MPRIPRPTEGAPVEPPPVLPQVKPVPRWIGPVFAVLAAITIPWTVYLAVTLPEHVQTRNYRVGWVGFDLGLIVLLLLTAQLAYRGQRHVAMAATATATALIVDAWFDIVNAPDITDLAVALLTALLGEVPLAGLCLWIALHVDRVIARRLRQLARRAERGPGGRGGRPGAGARGGDRTGDDGPGKGGRIRRRRFRVLARLALPGGITFFGTPPAAYQHRSRCARRTVGTPGDRIRQELADPGGSSRAGRTGRGGCSAGVTRCW
jgi:uncharacterized membrane protein YgcG